MRLATLLAGGEVRLGLSAGSSCCTKHKKGQQISTHSDMNDGGGGGLVKNTYHSRRSRQHCRFSLSSNLPFRRPNWKDKERGQISGRDALNEVKSL